MFKYLGSKKYPKGPDLRKVREHFLDLSGTKIYFKTPLNSDPDVPFIPKPERYNIYDESNFWSNPDRDGSAMSLEGGYTENWAYFGFPIFRSIGSLSFGIGLIRNLEFGSLFSPDNFVNALNNWVIYDFGPLSGLDQGNFSSIRKDWFIQILDNVQFVHFEVNDSDCIQYTSYWLTPITDDHYIYLSFNKLIHDENTNLQRAYDELIEKVLSSVRIEWSPDALRQQAEAREKWPDQSLPEFLPELTWTEEEWLAGESEDQREMREYDEFLRELSSKSR